MQIAAKLTFGRTGDSQQTQLDGFAAPEDGFTWSVGDASRLHLRLEPGGAGLDHQLELTLNPFVVPRQLAAQRLEVIVNGVPVAEEYLQSEGTVSYRLPARCLRADGGLDISLNHPQACCPADFGIGDDRRRLGFMLRSLRVLRLPTAEKADITVLPPIAWPAGRDGLEAGVEAATGLSPKLLTLCFESLGRNCEFGLVQQHFGADPLGLLRFAGITLDSLLNGLEDGFAHVGENVVVRTAPILGQVANGRSEYLVHDDRYDLSLHTFRSTDEASAEAVQAEHSQRLRFLRRMFTDRLSTGERIFIFQRPGQLTLSQARPLLTMLRRFGPNSLLYVDQTPGIPSGAVEQLDHGLFHGRLDHFAPAEEASLSDLRGWMSLCANTYNLWKGTK